LEKGYICLVHKSAAMGDTICVFFCLNMPFVTQSEDDHYMPIGQCYIQGFTEGETIKELEEG
jgi:hypothetical protein